MRSVVFSLVFAALLSSTMAATGFFDYRPGSTWTGECADGERQSPINVVTEDAVDAEDDAPSNDIKNMGVLKTATVYFTGAATQIGVGDWKEEATVTIPANDYTIGNRTNLKPGTPMEVEPLQAHFHTFSEHTIDGFYAPAEVHIVTRVKDGQSDHCDNLEIGCLAVFGVMLTFDGDGSKGNKAISRLFKTLPTGKGEEFGVKLKKGVDFNDLLPEDKSYYTYLGSLTTPPCSEIVTWNLFANPVHISKSAFDSHQMLTAFMGGDDCSEVYNGVCIPPREKTNHRNIQPLYGRKVTLHKA